MKENFAVEYTEIQISHDEMMAHRHIIKDLLNAIFSFGWM
jgi:hypothetical protein